MWHVQMVARYYGVGDVTVSRCRSASVCGDAEISVTLGVPVVLLTGVTIYIYSLMFSLGRVKRVDTSSVQLRHPGAM